MGGGVGVLRQNKLLAAYSQTDYTYSWLPGEVSPSWEENEAEDFILLW